MVLLAEMFNAHMKAIGIITVRWSSVDGLMYEVLRDRLLLPESAEKLRSCNAGRTRLRYFKKQIGIWNSLIEDKNAISGAVDILDNLYEDRNMIVHGQYGIIFEEDGSLSVSYSDIGIRNTEKSPSCRLEPAPVTIDHLMQHADAVYKAAKPLRDLLYQHFKTDNQ